MTEKFKVLALVAKNRIPNLDSMYKKLATYVDLQIIKLEKIEQRNLKKSLKEIDLYRYDRILIDLHFKNIFLQHKFIITIPNLVIYEEDACQNYITISKWFGCFLTFYKKIGKFSLICTSSGLASKLSISGVDATFLKKGYDQKYLSNEGTSRNIKIGFIGRINSETYAQRSLLVRELEQTIGLELIRTDTQLSYAKTLNKIKIFLSADIGLDEYMAKNFEAMACGCLVLAYRQGNSEEEALGLKDMENIVLYKDIKEIYQKLNYLNSTPNIITQIASNGQKLAQDNFSFNNLAISLTQVLIKKDSHEPPN